MKNYEITYKRRNGELVTHYVNWLPEYKIGEETRMGWIVIDIKKLWQNKYYSNAEYARKLYEHRKHQKKWYVIICRYIRFFFQRKKRNLKIRITRKIANW